MRPRAKQLKTAAVSHHGAPSSIDVRLPLPATTDGISDRLGKCIGLSSEGGHAHVQGLQGTQRFLRGLVSISKEERDGHLTVGVTCRGCGGPGGGRTRDAMPLPSTVPTSRCWSC